MLVIKAVPSRSSSRSVTPNSRCRISDVVVGPVEAELLLTGARTAIEDMATRKLQSILSPLVPDNVSSPFPPSR